MSYHAFLLCAMTPLLLPGLLAAQADPEKPLQKGEFRLSCERARVSVTSNEASSERILEDFSGKSGVVFNRYTGKEPNVTLDLRNVTYDDFLGRVLGSYGTKKKRVNGEVVVSSVTVMDDGDGSAAAPPPPPPPPNQPPRQENVSRSDNTRAREDALRRRRMHRRRPLRGGGGEGRPFPPGENPRREPPPSANHPPPPEEEPPPEQPPPDQEP